MVRINKDKLVMVAVQGEVSAPKIYYPYEILRDGRASHIVIGCGGICYNVKVGDRAFGWLADHIEPGVTIVPSEKNPEREDFLGLHIPSCIGNSAICISGDAKGAIGIVTGLHTGVIVDFEDKDLEKIAIGDKVLIKAYGIGLSLLNFPEIKCMNISPFLLEKICDEEDKLVCKVVREIPPQLMGSGIGVISPFYVDYDLMSSDEEMVELYGLENLRLGDIIAIEDHFSYYGPYYKKGAITIGVIIHGDSKISGHGPGVLPILTVEDRTKIKVVFEENANIGYYLGCGRFRK